MATHPAVKISIAQPHGMCTGVDRALKIAHQTLDKYPGETLWCFHEIVHNQHVVAQLKARGATFVNAINEIPEGSRVLFSAHGVSPAIWQEAHDRHLEIVDATCPFVAKVHHEARHFAQQNVPIALVGHKGHDEVVGVLGEAPDTIEVMESPNDIAALQQRWPNERTLALLSQTTISMEMFDKCKAALTDAGYHLLLPNFKDICYATQERQKAVRELAHHVEHIIVLGSPNSSNSQRLAEVAIKEGCPATLIASPEEIHHLPLEDVRHLGLTSGASTPEALFETLVKLLQN